MIARASISLTCAAFALASCSYGPSGGRIGETGQVQVIATESMPEPTAADSVGRTRSYLVGPLDVLTVDVLGMDNMSGREILVDSAGRISIPLAGSIMAAGSTPDALATLIEARLRERYMRDPYVTVNVKEPNSQFVTVEGQVVQPGNYPVLGDMTLVRAVASARGLGEFASRDDVVILRTVNGQRYAGVYNLAAIRRGNYPDPRVYANDIVVVGDSATLRRMRDLFTVLPALTSPLIYLLDNN
jgi:polysaccharide biosynthesis/export protein